jgi:hypothetical protein
MLPIPKFNSQVEDHLTLASLSKDCHDIISDHSFVKKGFKGKRNESLKLLSNRLQEIDVVVQRLLDKVITDGGRSNSVMSTTLRQ